MDWPPMIVAGFACLIATLVLYLIATRYIIPARSKEAQAMVYNLLPRFFLLQAFYDTQPSLPFLYKGEEWRHFYEKTKRELETIATVLAAAGEFNHDNIHVPELTVKRVSVAFDRHLLSYLQSQSKLAEMLHEYLPASGQPWASFLHGRREKFCSGSDYNLESDDSLLLLEEPEAKRSEALECLRMLVRAFLDDLEQIDCSISDATRGGTGAPSKPPQGAPSKITVYHATDRQVTEDGDYSAYRSKRGGLHYGRMGVSIPGSGREKGQRARPQNSEEADPLKHIVIFSTETNFSNRDSFLRNLGAALDSESELGRRPEPSENALLLYIHGFNTSHRSAIKTAARLKHDLGFRGEIIVYSWSSFGSKYAYRHDAAQIDMTVPMLVDFVAKITNDILGNPDVHIVAHSMGNRALIKALRQIQARPTLKNVVFAAADESRETFDGMVQQLQRSTGGGMKHQQQPQQQQQQQQQQQHSEGKMNERSADVSPHTPRLTVYSSTDDSALGISKFVNMEDRLGNTYSFLNRKQLESKGSDQVDVSGPKITKSWLHHSYHVEVPVVLQDIGHLLSTQQGALHRSSRPNPLIKPVAYKKMQFFAFDAEKWNDQQRCL